MPIDAVHMDLFSQASLPQMMPGCKSVPTKPATLTKQISPVAANLICLQAYQIAAAVVKLPPFQLPGAAAASSESIGLVALYGRVYCWIHDRAGRRVTMHRFYKCVRSTHLTTAALA